jgi:hypothetical protein
MPISDSSLSSIMPFIAASVPATVVSLNLNSRDSQAMRAANPEFKEISNKMDIYIYIYTKNVKDKMYMIEAPRLRLQTNLAR